MRFIPLLFVIPTALAAASLDDVLSVITNQLAPELGGIIGLVQNLGSTISGIDTFNGDVSTLTQTLDPGNPPVQNQTLSLQVIDGFVNLAGSYVQVATGLLPVIASQVPTLTNIGTLRGLGGSGAAVFGSGKQAFDELAAALQSVLGGSTAISNAAGTVDAAISAVITAFNLLSVLPI